MVFHYYPGCTLKTKAIDLDKYARASAEALGITLAELDNWQCCGGAFTMAKDEIATKLSSVRALADSRDSALVTVCSACHNVIKQTNDAMKNDAEFAMKVNNYICSWMNPIMVKQKFTIIWSCCGMSLGSTRSRLPSRTRSRAKRSPAYYGCLLLRPGKVLQMDNPENPQILEDFIRAIGATPVISPYRNECCGGYMATEDKALAAKKSGAVMDSAKEMGADMMITACPLCLYNLTKNAPGEKLPVYYFTELLAEALGVKE